MMKKIFVATSVALLIAASHASAMDSLSQYAWKHRVLILFGSSGDQKLAQQVQILKGKTKDLAERDMVVFSVIGDDVRPVYGDASKVDARKLRQDAGIRSGSFQAVLVGKDGGVKLRSQTVVTDSNMFGLIDRMPMRKAGQG
jgi:hypothetical protein